jgi:polysaccharide export outer membrane protein
MNPTKSLGKSWRGFATPALCVITLVLVSWMPCQASEEGSNNPAHVNASTESGEYRLAPGDKLTVIIFDQPQLSGDFTIDGTGEILLPLAGTAAIAGLTLAEAQQRIQERFADGILVHPAISVRVAEYRPIFVTGHVRKPGNYPFIVGASLKAAIVVAGGLGEPSEQASVGMSDAIMAKERLQQLETNHLALLVHKARLEAQRDEATDFVMPQLVGFDANDVEFRSLYSAENNTFLRLAATYQSQLKVLQQQRPRIEDEIHAVTDQIAKERDRLDIVSQRIDEYQDLVNRGLVRKPELTERQIEKSLVQAEVSRLQGEIAHLQQNAGELEVKQEEVKANYKRQVLTELQETSQHLLDIDATLGTARQLRNLKAQGVGFGDEEPNYTILITRAEQSGTVTVNATADTKLEPGDVIEVKLNRRDPIDSPATEAALNRQKAPAQREPVPVDQQHTLLVPSADSAADNISEPSFLGSGQQRSTSVPAVCAKTHSILQIPIGTYAVQFQMGSASLLWTDGNDSAPKTTSRERYEQQSFASED